MTHDPDAGPTSRKAKSLYELAKDLLDSTADDGDASRIDTASPEPTGETAPTKGPDPAGIRPAGTGPAKPARPETPA